MADNMSGKSDDQKKPGQQKPARELLSEPLDDKVRGVFEVIQNAIPEDVTHVVEHRVSQLPSVGILGVALGAMGISATLAMFNERKGWSNFFGNWVPSLLFLTVY